MAFQVVEMAPKVLIVFAAVLLAFAAIWLSLGSLAKCTVFYGKNICNFYEVRDSSRSFEEKMSLCGEMTDVPKKDNCYETIAENASDAGKAMMACNQISGFEGVHSKEECLDRIRGA